jgi:hypothetical protein
MLNKKNREVQNGRAAMVGVLLMVGSPDPPMMGT